MKILRYCLSFVVLLLAACSSSTNNNVAEPADPATDDLVVEEFITNMYNNDLYMDYDFLEEHCSKGLLEKLEADYDYESDGKSYAVWDFRTSAQDSKPDADAVSKIISVKPDGDGWYTYEFLDGGWKGVTKVKCSVHGGKVTMEELIKVFDEVETCLTE